MAAAKNFLFILRHPPHDGIVAQETLDQMLTVAAFDQPTRLLFLDDGVFQLKSGQRPDGLGLKHISPMFEALAVFDVEGLWVEAESLHERALTPAGLSMPVHLIARAQVPAFLATADVLVSA